MKAKVIFCLLLLVVGIVSADSPKLGRLVVTVKNEEGSPLEYANITCIQGDRRITGNQTNSQGRALILIPPGNYRLRAMLIGYNPVDSIFVDVTEDSTTEVPTIILNDRGVMILPNPAIRPINDPPRETLGRIALKVCDQTGQGLADCTYELFQDSLLVLSGTVNPRGMIVLASLKTGIYILKISRAGFRTTLVKGIPVRPMKTSNCIVSLSEDASGTADPQILQFVDLPEKHSDEVRTIDLDRLDQAFPDVIH